MKLVIQRVKESAVYIDNKCQGQIKNGFCILVAMVEEDTIENIQKMAKKIVQLRVFADENGKMNKSLTDVNGSVLVVSQFTLLADCSHGRRPSFLGAGNFEKTKQLFQSFVTALQEQSVPVETGVFGADMLVQITNDGPATFILEG